MPTVFVRLSDGEEALLDEFRFDGESRPAAVRRLLNAAPTPVPRLEPNATEARLLLAEKARSGNVQAIVAYDRAYRDEGGPESYIQDRMDELARAREAKARIAR